MNQVTELLDTVKRKAQIASDNALAIRLGTQRQFISKVRMGEKTLSDERIAQLCIIAKIDGPTWTAKIHAERAASQTEKTMWKEMLNRLNGTLTTLVAVTIASSIFKETNAQFAFIPILAATNRKQFSKHCLYFIRRMKFDSLVCPEKNHSSNPTSQCASRSHNFRHQMIHKITKLIV